MTQPRRTALIVGLALGAAIAAAGAGEPPPGDVATVETVLANHLEARGGAEPWSRVRAIRIEGTWTAFSTDGAMTVLRMRPDRYRFDHVLFGQPATLAYDGEKAWVRGAALGAPNGQEITDNWKRNVILDARFGSPLLAHASEGATVELIGREDLDGQDVWVLEVTPADTPKETWYLDADTHLEVKRVSRVLDIFSGPNYDIEMETYWDDFREVAGVVVPFHEERHFGIRYQVWEASSVEINPEIDASSFGMPTPPAEPEAAPDGPSPD